MGRTKKSRKVSKVAIATLASATLVLTGTFAWQAISQEALNEAVVDVNPGGRLHDDFNGENKDVYVENFTSAEDNGVDIYARIRLYEYMELGPDAGTSVDEGAERKAASIIDGATFDDVDKWSPYIPDQTNPAQPKAGTDSDKIHKYWDWTLGMKEAEGENEQETKYYMPTFNKNKDSLEADINGTLEGHDPTTDVDQYGDYVVYTKDSKVTGTEVYDNDTNDIDEREGAKEPENITSKKDVEHEAKETLHGTVISMEQWLKAPVAGNYWVYDEDGWAYWANPIEPGTATGLLLNHIYRKTTPDENWYYGINVVAQFATVGDWGYDDNTGFYNPSEGTAPSDNALKLLGVISGMGQEVTVTAEGNATTVAPEGTLNFTALLTEAGAGLEKQPTDWAWTVTAEGATALDEGSEDSTSDGNSAPGRFDRVDPNSTDTMKLTVNSDVPRGTVLTITATGTIPVDSGEEDEGTAAVDAGDSEGETDDGTTDDTTAIPETVSGSIKVTVYEVFDVSGDETAAKGGTITLTAASEPAETETVEWTVEKKMSSETFITANATDGEATLTIGADERATELIVRVKYLNGEGKVVADGKHIITVTEPEEP